jgi:serine/threonine protein kinase
MTEQTDNRNALPTGYRLGDYEIQKVLGEGAFGITYLAKNKKLDTLVAIKEFLPNVIAIREGDYTVHAKSQKDEDNFTWAADRFIQEAKILAKFEHPNLVQILFCFKANNTAYIIMEYEQGQSLEKLLKEGKTFTEEELLRIFLPLLDGLELVHQSDYIHRDIKPENIYFRDSDHSLVLIDFGSARYDVSNRSQAVTAIVTPGYAPFEQYETNGKRQGPWTDIYALGAVLYRIISRKTPIASSERISVLYRKRPDPLTPAVEIGSGVYSKQFLESIDWALTINEDERPQSVTSWRKKLLGQADSIPAQPESNSVTISNTHLKPVDNSVFLKWGLVGVGVLLLSVIIIVAVNWSPETEENKLANTEERLRIAKLEKEIEIAKGEADKARIEREEAQAMEAERRSIAREEERRRIAREAERRSIAREAERRSIAREAERRRIEHEQAQVSKAPMNLVRGYYEDLNNNDKYSAIPKWIKRPTKATISGMTGNEFFRVNEIQLIDLYGNNASVSVDVTGKKRRRKAENWRLTVELKKVYGEWKIVRFKNAYKY